MSSASSSSTPSTPSNGRFTSSNPGATKPSSDVTDTTSNAVIEGLKNGLADTYALYFKTQVSHWNVTGPLFASLHVLFEGQYEELAEAIDEVAERVRALGQLAPTSLRDIATRSSIEDATDETDGVTLAGQLAADHEALAASLTRVCERAEEAGDQGTLDMLGARIKVHQKHAWMLRSHLG